MRKKTNCCVVSCYNNSYTVETKGVSYFQLPKDKNRATLWLTAMGNPRSKNKLLFCELHFEKKFIRQGPTRKRLAKCALPTLEGPDPAVAETCCRRWRTGRLLVCHRATQTLAPDDEPPTDPLAQPIIDIFVKEETVLLPADSPGPSSFIPIPIKQEPDEGDQSESQETDPELNMLIKLTKAHLSPELARFINVQVALKRDVKAATQSKWDEEMLLFSLKLFHKYPQTYKLMYESLGLPPLEELKRLFRASSLDEQWARGLARRFTDLTVLERDCVVCVARTPLRRALRYDEAQDRLVGLHEIDGAQWPCTACSGVIIVARGLHARWRQPLACCMLGAGTDTAELRFFLDKLISQLFDVGLIVRAVVTDFDNAFNPTSCPMKPLRPFYDANLGPHTWRIFNFYDCTLLIVRFRDIFMEYDVNFDGMVASWGDIEKLYEYDKDRADKLAPQLARGHVQPPDTRRAAHAVEALAPEVGAALAAAVDLGVLDEEARGTARLVSVMGTLYETLHRPGPSCRKYPHEEVKFLKETLNYFDKMSLVDKKTRAAVADPGVLAACSAAACATLALVEAARATGVAELPMRAINNDPLQDFFEGLCELNEGENPTAGQFLGAFKKTFAFHSLKPIKLLKKETLDGFLNAACEVRRVPCAALQPPERQVPRARLENLSLPPVPVVAVRRIIAARLLEHCLVEHAGCAHMEAYCYSPQLPVGFRRLLEALEAKFRGHMSGSRASGGLLAGLLQLVEPERFEQPCACFPLPYLKNLFMRYRIRSLTHHNNQRLNWNKDSEFSLDSPFRNTERWGEA